MRTTVTLDEDVAAKLREVARERGVSFKAALNESVRAGLVGEGRSARPYRTRARSMGLRKGIDLDHTGRLLAEIDNAEIIRKLQLGK
jgi:predicted transcriptional regulator